MSEKKRIYRCLIAGCGFEADTLDEITEHIEHGDRMHEFHLEKLGLSNCYQEGLLNSEELAEREDSDQTVLTIKKKKPQPSEWTDYAYDPKYSRPYPAYPYYKLKETNEFGCIAEPVFKTRDAKEFLAYMYESHREDAIEWMKNHLRNKLVDKIRLGSSELISDATLEKMTNDEFRELCMYTELKSKQPEVMGGLVSGKHERLKEFLQGRLDVCPECNLASVNLSANDKEAHREKLILDGIKTVNAHLSSIEYDPKKPKGYYEHLTHQKFSGTWNGESISLCLLCNMHAHLRHPLSYKLLWDSKILGGQLPDYLASESYLSGKKPLRTEMNLSKVDLMKWLKRGGE